MAVLRLNSCVVLEDCHERSIHDGLVRELEGLKYQPIINHGTVYAYNKHKCRCEFCKEAKAISNQRTALKAKMKAVDLG